MTAPDDITPEEAEQIQKRCDAATPWLGTAPDGTDHRTAVCVPQITIADMRYEENFAFIAHARTDIPKLLAALRRRDARIEELSVSHDKFYRAYDAANAKLARAVALLNRSRGGTTTDDDAITAFLAEIEAEHGK